MTVILSHLTYFPLSIQFLLVGKSSKGSWFSWPSLKDSQCLWPCRKSLGICPVLENLLSHSIHIINPRLLSAPLLSPEFKICSYLISLHLFCIRNVSISETFSWTPPFTSAISPLTTKMQPLSLPLTLYSWNSENWLQNVSGRYWAICIPFQQVGGQLRNHMAAHFQHLGYSFDHYKTPGHLMEVSISISCYILLIRAGCSKHP